MLEKTNLSNQEISWLLENRITRISDKKEVLIYPMGAERYLSLVLSGKIKGRYNISNDILNKNILIIPGYGNSAFLFANIGAKSITVYDKDPVTIAWIKAFKKYYHYREYSKDEKPYPSIGEILTAITAWYPPLIKLPKGKFSNYINYLINPKALRRTYIFYMMNLVHNALESKINHEYELDHDIKFHVGEINDIKKSNFDTAFVPYLLGVKNGIEETNEVVDFIKQLIKLVPAGNVLINPSRSTKEFYIIGKSYFKASGYKNITEIPEIKSYVKDEDKYWFKTQGIAIFCRC